MGGAGSIIGCLRLQHAHDILGIPSGDIVVVDVDYGHATMHIRDVKFRAPAGGQNGVLQQTVVTNKGTTSKHSTSSL